MKKSILLILILFSSISYGQTLNKENIIGLWGVEKITGDFPEMPAEQQKIMDNLKSAFMKSTFEFKEDNRFNFNIEFMKELDEMMKNVHWKLDSNKSEIIIQEWKDKDTDKYQLMGIQISQKNGKTYFVLTESPFVLEMKKK
ncbi:hypothetical protein SCB49_11397 [unidentified eubacterium SCB49]|nr:hypothetical protein SCB49_11397 [unidentified eubacterium SCB49]